MSSANQSEESHSSPTHIEEPSPAMPKAGGEGSWDAVPSNTASHSCKTVEKILRWGVDSLYLSFAGTLTEAAELKLQQLKAKAQNGDPAEKLQAQWVIDGHAFEVKDKGAGIFAFVLEDGCFRIALSKTTAKRVPLASVKLSARYLSSVTPREGMEAATRIVSRLGLITGEPQVSRIDLFVDFSSFQNMEAWDRFAWVTRASDVRQYADGQRFSGWMIGAGGPIMMRLYDKDLEIEKSGKQYLRSLWDQAGWKEGEPVWRLEFEFKRELLTRLGLSGFSSVFGHLNGLWSYAVVDWLRLTLPNRSDSTRSRWPIHPLWLQLSGIDFGSHDVAKLTRVIKTDTPSESSIARRALSALAGFMAVKGIHEMDEGFESLRMAMHNSLHTDAFYQGKAPAALIQEKVALKQREYFIQNGPDGIDDPLNDEEDGIEYRKASRGG